MKTIRIRIILLESWLIFFCVIAILLNSFTFSMLMIGIVYATVFSVIVIPQIAKAPLWSVLIIPAIALMVSQYTVKDFSGNLAILFSVIEVFSIVITTTLSRWVSMGLSEFDPTVASNSLGEGAQNPESADSGQGLIYREVRRARNHQRPLTLLSISIDEKSIAQHPDSRVQNSRQLKKLQVSFHNLSKLLCEQLEDCAVIVQNKEHYLAALPETTPEELPFIVKRLQQKTRELIGVEIKIGAANLPQDGYTFEGLFEKATQLMLKDREPQPSEVIEPYPVEQQIIR
ncbi:MAG: hypothetical protein CVU39_18465 [Chloroflexi bacterium HGW-Chloroflexi-10]|nr:MAG: hypothetical protein CVU39_18465 [Chloroflexi bacterium HGW-Chloroflexi-10]